MILSSHIIVGSAVAESLMSNSLTAGNAAAIFIIALASHYVLDIIPHWHYCVPSIDKDREEFISDKKIIARDALKVFLDGLIGLAVVLWLIGLPMGSNKIFIVGIIVFASILPDFLSAMYFIYNKSYRTSDVPNIDGNFRTSEVQRLKMRVSQPTFLKRLLGKSYRFHYRIHSPIKLDNQPVKGISLNIIVIALIIVLARVIF